MNVSSEQSRAPIWIVEDCDADFDASEWVFRQLGLLNPLVRLRTEGELLAAMERCLGDGRLVDLPRLVLLDLNLPGGRRGTEILVELKSHALFCAVPVVMLTSSKHPRDIGFCYAKGASGYFCKPETANGWKALLAAIKSYWIDHSLFVRELTLPPPHPPG